MKSTKRFNENYFENIDSEEKAYWLGFISADGSISLKCKNSGSLQIKLASRDKNHLQKFLNSIEYSGLDIKDSITISKSKNKEYFASGISIPSKKICLDLIGCGVTQNKTFTLKSWNGPENLMRYYWRGFFDGDGCLSKTKNKAPNCDKYYRFSCGLVGTYDVVENFIKHIKDNLEIDGKIVKQESVFIVAYGGMEKTQKITAYLYNEANIYLDRKYILHKDINENYRNTSKDQIKFRKYSKEELIEFRSQCTSWAKVAKMLGGTEKGLYNYMDILGLARRPKRKNHYKESLC